MRTFSQADSSSRTQTERPTPCTRCTDWNGERVKELHTESRNGEQVTLVDEDGILPCDYVYTPKGGLKMYYEGEHVGFHR